MSALRAEYERCAVELAAARAEAERARERVRECKARADRARVLLAEQENGGPLDSIPEATEVTFRLPGETRWRIGWIYAGPYTNGDAPHHHVRERDGSNLYRLTRDRIRTRDERLAAG